MDCSKLRIFFQVIIGTFNDDVPKLATDTNFATNWVETNIVPYASLIKFLCISVGNEIIPGNLASSVLAAMENLDAAVKSFGYAIPVSTSIGFAALASSYPPSSGDFKDKEIMREITGYLTSHGFPLLLTAYPYFAYASDPSHIKLSYALMNSTETFVRDGDLEYKNMFDAMVDSVYSAAEKVGAGGLDIVVAESGWPSNGNGEYTTPSLAQTYNQNLVRHAGSGTPKNPGKSVETYVFALFNENQKTPGVEQNFGLFYPDMS
ncbi:putative glucan endo-1,3-beta-glucosidase GVI, partial [Tanacetum coccineum]